MKTKLTFALAAIVAITVCSLQKANAQYWSLTGNTLSTDAKLGTLNKFPIPIITNNIERMRITSSGYVGIGKTNPVSILDVKGGNWNLGSTEGDFRIGNSTYRLKIGVATAGGGAGDARIRAAGGTNRLMLGTNDALTIDGLGQVGIGNINPSNTLDVLGEAHFHSTCGSEFCPASVFAEAITGDGVNGQSTYRNGVAGYSTNGNGIYGNSINSNGISAYSSSYDGLYAYTNNPEPRYAGYFDGDVISTGHYYGSDQKLKQNIQDFSAAMDIINKLQPKQYEFRKDGNYKLMNLPQGNHYGLIAQDVEKILPNLVKDSKFETRWAKPDPTKEDIKNSETIEFKALNYTELIPIIIKGMQEQQVVITRQQQQIDELKQTVNQLAGGQVVNINTASAKITNAVLSNALLEQNTPNPFNQNTLINYFVPQNSGNAVISITDMNGKIIKTFAITTKGNGQLLLQADLLSAGTYQYSLTINGKLIETKKMVLIK